MIATGRRVLAGAFAVSALTGSCATEVGSTPEDALDAPTTATSPGTTATTSAPVEATARSTTSTLPTATSPTTTSPATTSPATTSTTPTTTVPAVADVGPTIDPGEAPSIEPNSEVVIGTSVDGRPITLVRRGTPGGTRILVVGVIHGNEDAGLEVIDRLRTAAVPPGVELFLVPSMNPDGQAAEDRQNANQVDLNRNFPTRWAELGVVGDWQYGGPAPASEPETMTMVQLGRAITPDLVFWYHQDAFRISPARGRAGEIRARFADLTGLPLVGISGGTYTGTAAQWAATVVPDDGVGITVELGETISDAEAAAHADAILTVASEYFGPTG